VATTANGNGTKMEAEKKKLYEFMSRDTTNVEHGMFDYTGNNWSQRISNKSLKEKFGARIKQTFGRLAIQDRNTWNITHHTESAAV
jgi:hypothetical protein